MLAHARFLLTRMGGGYSAAVAVVFLLALGVRLAYVGRVPPRMTPDSADYLTLAENLAEHHAFSLSAGEPFVPTIRRAPGYPLFLVLAGGAPRAVQSVLDALTAAMICAIAGRLGRLRWGIAAGLVWAAHPGAIVYADSILSESLFTFLLTGAVALLAARWPAAAGVAMGMAALTRPIGAALAVPIAAVLLFSAIPRRRASAALFCASMLAVVGPWIVRSSLLGGRFVLVSATAPLNYSIATVSGRWDLNDQASIFGGAYFREIDPCGRAFSRARTPHDSVRADDVCLHEALANVRHDPAYYARGRISQLVHFPLTSFDFATGIRSTIGDAIAKRKVGAVLVKAVLYTVFSLAPLLLGMAGTVAGRRPVEVRLAAAVWIFTILIHAPGFVEYRYFLPAVPMLLVCATTSRLWPGSSP